MGQITMSSIEPLATPCGIWYLTVTPGPLVVRPDSEVVVTEVPGDPGRGGFAGVFDLNAILLFTHSETGRTVDFPLPLGFSLAGPWALADPDGLPTADNLVLLGDRIDGQTVIIEKCVPPEDVPIDKPGYCTLCWGPKSSMDPMTRREDVVP